MDRSLCAVPKDKTNLSELITVKGFDLLVAQVMLLKTH